MVDAFSQLSRLGFDFLLGWSLHLPSDVTIIVVALLSAGILVGIRLVTTDQDLLARIARDRKRQQQILKAGKAAGDREEVARARTIRRLVAVEAMQAEVRPLLVSLVPIAMLATWCIYRLEFHPPREGEELEIIAYTPAAAEGQLIHIVPVEGLEAEGWIRRIEIADDGGPPHGMARWTVRGLARPEPYDITFRRGERTFHHPLLIGQEIYRRPIIRQDEQWVTEVRLRLVKLFGIVPGIPAIAFPPWLVAYLLLTFPLVPLLKRAVRMR